MRKKRLAVLSLDREFGGGVVQSFITVLAETGSIGDLPTEESGGTKPGRGRRIRQV